MPRQQSQQSAGATGRFPRSPQQRGRLYVVAVPIGHPDDITIRAIRVLHTVHLIASEHPTATQELLSYHSIQNSVTSYGPMNLSEKVQILIHRLHQGTDIALVSDCGSPLIVDPGKLLVEAAHAEEIPVISIPGPSALSAAIAVSGLIGESFSFYGRLPTTQARIAHMLATNLQHAMPLIAFCTGATATHALSVLEKIAPRRLVALACDLTKPNERIIRGTARDVRERLLGTPSEEVTLIMTGRRDRTKPPRATRSDQSLSSRRIKTR